MIGIFVCCLYLAAEPGGSESVLGAPAERAILNTVWNALQSDKELANQHRGYLTFLDEHPEIASAEAPYSDLTTLSRFREAVSGFDEVLQRQLAQQKAFDKYYEALAADRDLRQAVEDLQRLELTQRELARDYGAAMTYLRAHGDLAIRFLENPARIVPTPEALYPLVSFLKKRPEVRQELLARFRKLSEFPAAHAAVFPWWETLATPAPNLSGGVEGEGNIPASRAYERLMRYFANHPHQYWIWHNRSVSLAKAPHARDWIRYWHDRVRRHKDLSRTYLEYLKLTRSRPELRKAAFEAWEKELGAAPPWPPEGTPPQLAAPVREKRPIPEKPTKADLKPNAVPRPSQPPKPSTSLPRMPTPPARPTRPNLKW
jgi:hypothetical protein